jgi:hypothetical protein
VDEGKRFFFEKKKQKTFLNWAVLVSPPQSRFFQKAAAFFHHLNALTQAG